MTRLELKPINDIHRKIALEIDQLHMANIEKIIKSKYKQFKNPERTTNTHDYIHSSTNRGQWYLINSCMDHRKTQYWVYFVAYEEGPYGYGHMCHLVKHDNNWKTIKKYLSTGFNFGLLVKNLQELSPNSIFYLPYEHYGLLVAVDFI